MNTKELIKQEFSNFSKKELIVFISIICFVIVISLITHDDKIALISAICGISYTILAGKGRVSCYFIGITGTLCYSYLSFRNGFFGHMALYLLYYFPMEIIGIFKWSKHLKKETREIQKAKLSLKERYIYLAITSVLTVAAVFILKRAGDLTPFMDSFTTMFSVLGLFLTVKRCIEQWYVWAFVNFISLIMWIYAYINGSECIAAILMWLVYFIVGIYFLICWQKEMKSELKNPL